ncbi:twin-arginine translocation signal domain-containing protein [Coriobacteriales bacterium OH1046]|nr:twin-arginine translocation signal domain-containing protein [Coriobacteriales bacterium OH1046]
MAAWDITRRSFLKGGVAAGVAAAAVTLLPGCANPASSSNATPDPTVIPEEDGVDALETYEYQDLGLTPGDTFELPLGNVLLPSEGNWIPVMTAGAAAMPMVKASVLSLASGTLMEVVPQPLTVSPTNVIYDVRCSADAFAWVELDMITRAWSLYGARFSAGSLMGATLLLAQGDKDWDPPAFCCSGQRVLWQVQPSLSGGKTAEHSFCYLWNVGRSDAQAVVESPGRFATGPTPSGTAITLTPRVRADEGVYYGVTCYSLGDDLATIIDQLVMPESVRPMAASRVGDRFVVSVEASYDSGGLLGGMGTFITGDDGKITCFWREPAEGACGSGDLFIIKSRASYFALDVGTRTYGFLPAIDRSVDYGEFPARAGEFGDSFVTYATVKDEKTGYPSKVVARTFVLQTGNRSS